MIKYVKKDKNRGITYGGDLIKKTYIFYIIIGIVIFSKNIYASDVEVKFLKDDSEIIFDDGEKPIIQEGITLVPVYAKQFANSK